VKPAKNSPAAERTIVSTRVVSAPVQRVWDAWADPLNVVQWWGPNGFSSRIQEFDLRPGGAWRFVMRGPDGKEYPNIKRFSEVSAPRRVVFDHEEEHHRFRMTIDLGPAGAQTRVTWTMVFEALEDCRAARTFIEKANEENLDRLENFLTRTKS
jgi:uncharacterized protein YndB with AHSA1/START domain